MTTVGLQNNTNGTNGSTDGGDGVGVGGGGGGKQGNIYDYPTHKNVALVAIVIFVCGAMFVPAIIICVCYTFIAYFIWMRLKSGMQIAPKKTRNSTDLDQLDDQSGSDIMSRRKIKNIIMIFVVVIVFILCWSPCVSIYY
ncbi:hypothetical protein KUTeg_012757 [Tegillarca granosa]|uniref:G-protein coupled receptors family 1 profile domain-containing protein n=1 Tax=Tegillarca granosa TaxID=220873 RepID=A0ABQ9F3R6_TEGGR|nr:hypothetical protein KUTeg_012757 [Tegillarca granosa]